MTLLDEASALARKDGHAQVTDAHLLRVLLTRASVRSHLMKQRICTPKLGQWALARLAEAPCRGGYRDNEAPEVPATIHEVFAPRSSILGRRFEPSEKDVLAALLARNRLTELTWDDAPIWALHDAAQQMMRSRGHVRLLVDHALAALAAGQGDDGRFAKAFTLLGIASPAEALRARLTRTTVGQRLAPVDDLVQHAILKSSLAQREELGIDFLVVELLRHAGTGKIFEQLAVPLADFIHAYVHRIAPQTLAPKLGPAEVVFYNDDVTTMKDVVGVLVDHFDQDEADAMALMKTVHDEGSVALVVTDGRDAADAIRACRLQTPTLRIELREVSS